MSFFYDPNLFDELVKLKGRFHYDIFIETGTEKGDSVRKVLDLFESIHTCEIDEKYFTYHIDLENYEKVKLHKGNSPELLDEIFKFLKHDKFILYLDAHWRLEWPLLDELKIIKKYNYKPVIIIHDFETGIQGHIGDKYDIDGKIIRLNWDYIIQDIESIYGRENFDYHYNGQSIINRGCVFIYPKL